MMDPAAPFLAVIPMCDCVVAFYEFNGAAGGDNLFKRDWYVLFERDWCVVDSDIEMSLLLL